MQFSRSDFPEGFLFGVATSAYQIEGHAFGGAGPTHWDSFAATPGNVVRAEHGARACDHYHRWEEDLDLIAALAPTSTASPPPGRGSCPRAPARPMPRASISTTGWWTGCSPAV
jgi:hypothetical protein